MTSLVIKSLHDCLLGVTALSSLMISLMIESHSSLNTDGFTREQVSTRPSVWDELSSSIFRYDITETCYFLLTNQKSPFLVASLWDSRREDLYFRCSLAYFRCSGAPIPVIRSSFTILIQYFWKEFHPGSPPSAPGVHQVSPRDTPGAPEHRCTGAPSFT